ncbi:hypothetical protein KUM42_07685 [Modestobacter sp. L9-4]|uniref:hypothetical protein n=1 Tax=Modestobacter sp. L9-4 TaxID=2851567 RepID=UPI001C750A93|nr:hypothetical protein [Modestobacter sp. L9-4]QXG77376.1 hypothetical protein KUM42_07685 [Modestobacter sp. L9-4]
MTAPRSDPPPGRTAVEDALLTQLETLAGEHAAVPDPGFRQATRGRLVAMAAVAGPPGRRAPAPDGVLRRLLASPPGRPRRRRLAAGLTAAALTLAVSGGVLVAAQGARPGDLLYDVKRGSEHTQLSLAADGERGHTLLDFASTRLREVGDLVGVHVTAAAAVAPAGGGPVLAAGPDAGLLVSTLGTMDAQTTQGTADLTSRAVDQRDRAAVEELIGWADRQRAGIAELAPAVPADARDAVADADRLAGDVAARGAALRLALACPAGPATDGVDALGPRPAPCPPAATESAAAGTTVVSGPSATTAASSTATRTSASASSAASRTSSGSPPPVAPGARTTPAPRPTLPTVSTAVPRPTTSASRPVLPSPTLPSIPLPSLPVPSVSLPPVPGRTAPTSSAATSSPGAVVQLPSVAPGLSVCVPPLVSVGCRPSGG